MIQVKTHTLISHLYSHFNSFFVCLFIFLFILKTDYCILMFTALKANLLCDLMFKVF